MTYTDPYPGRRGDERVIETCGRCAGSGLYDGPTSIKDTDGRPFCLYCGGKGEHSVLVSSVRARVRRQAEAPAKAAKEAAERRALADASALLARIETERAVAEWTEANPAHAAAIARWSESNDFVRELGERVAEGHGLTEKQAAALLRTAERLAAEAAQPTAPVVEGRVEIAGEVVSTKYVESQWGGAVKMLVRDDRGFKVYGTVPTDLLTTHYYDEHGAYQYEPGVDRGDRVAFTATVERSRDDEAFGFFKRPTKARRLP